MASRLNTKREIIINTKNTKNKLMKTIYALKVRLSDEHEWSEPQYYKSKQSRDIIGSKCRIMGALRTFSFEEIVTKEEANKKCVDKY